MRTWGRAPCHRRMRRGERAGVQPPRLPLLLPKHQLDILSPAEHPGRMEPMRAVRAGSVEELERDGRLLTKVGSLPVLVVSHDGCAYAIEDRCPHLGFPLHQGTVEAGLVTCHWHHARFDLASGCTLDPWADDAAGFDVALDDGEVLVAARPDRDPVGRLQRRLRDGLEQGITL